MYESKFSLCICFPWFFMFSFNEFGLSVVPSMGETMEWWLILLVSLTQLFKFQFINSKHKLLKFNVYMKNV